MNIQTSKTTDEASIRGVIDQRARAFHDRDVDGVVSCRTDDYVQYSLAPPLSHVSDPRNLAGWFATWQGPVGSELHDLRIAASGDTAFSFGLSRMSGTKADGIEVGLWFRETLCFRKTNGSWKIAHEHCSVPFCMDGSFRAAVDLKP
jgi:ketosteroid isomerase-like protein